MDMAFEVFKWAMVSLVVGGVAGFIGLIVLVLRMLWKETS